MTPSHIKDKLLEVYGRLLDEYGPQYWWPGDTPFEVIIGTILTQATSWANAERAIDNLKAGGKCTIHALKDIGHNELASLLYPSVYFNAKARKIKEFVAYLQANYKGDLDLLLHKDLKDLRIELLGIYGIGNETADDIVLYAANKPSFVIDSYTRRILDRLGMSPPRYGYLDYQKVFMENLPLDPALFNEFHALLDEHAARKCHKTRPECNNCCLLKLCATGCEYTNGLK